MPLDEARRTLWSESTAESAAMMRAAGAGARDPALRNPDYLASRFVSAGPRVNALVKVPGVRALIPRVAERVVPGSFWFETGRTKYMDEVLLREVADGARQVVILGAGYDTRAYRFRDQLAGIPIFEVDHPITSARKRDRVRRALGELPSEVSYVTVDFEREGLGDRLEAAGYDPAARTVLLWSGVTMYITADAVAGVLGFVRERSGPGSAIVFDYVYRELLEGQDGYHGARQLRRYVERQGEPFRFGIPEGDVERFLAGHGLECSTDMTPEEFARRYLSDSSGRVRGRPYGGGGLTVGRVPARPVGG